MHDLLYTEELSNKVKEQLTALSPEIKIESTWDDIHGERLSLEIPEEKRKEYLKFIIKEGYGSLSFYIQMTINAPNFKVKNERLEIMLQEIRDIVDEIMKEEKEDKDGKKVSP